MSEEKSVEVIAGSVPTATCKVCKEKKTRIFSSMYKANYIYVDGAGKRWKNSLICPDCFRDFERERKRKSACKE